MDAIYTRFESYDFEGDGKFQNGLASLTEGTKDVAKVLDMKLFFYNRFVEPVDPTGYKQWSSGPSQVLPSTACSAEQLDKLNPLVLSKPHSGSSKNNIEEETSTDTGAPPQLSFAEVMRLIQEGEEVPGVAKLDIQPSNQNPTPPQCQRVLKPWETSSSSK